MTAGTLFNIADDGVTFWHEPELPFDTAPPAAAAVDELVIVVPCSGDKSPTLTPAGRLPAGELYIGAFHRYARSHAARLGADRVLILSALHGLITLDKLVAGYDRTIDHPDSIAATPGIVRNQARTLGLTRRGVRVVSFCPTRYTAVLVGAGLADLVTPLAGSRGIGEQRGRIAALDTLRA